MIRKKGDMLMKCHTVISFIKMIKRMHFQKISKMLGILLWILFGYLNNTVYGQYTKMDDAEQRMKLYEERVLARSAEPAKSFRLRSTTPWNHITDLEERVYYRSSPYMPGVPFAFVEDTDDYRLVLGHFEFSIKTGTPVFCAPEYGWENSILNLPPNLLPISLSPKQRPVGDSILLLETMRSIGEVPRPQPLPPPLSPPPPSDNENKWTIFRQRSTYVPPQDTRYFTGQMANEFWQKVDAFGLRDFVIYEGKYPNRASVAWGATFSSNDHYLVVIYEDSGEVWDAWWAICVDTHTKKRVWKKCLQNHFMLESMDFFGHLSHYPVAISDDGQLLYCAVKGNARGTPILKYDVKSEQITRIERSANDSYTLSDFIISPNNQRWLRLAQVCVRSDDPLVFEEESPTGMVTRIVDIYRETDWVLENTLPDFESRTFAVPISAKVFDVQTNREMLWILTVPFTEEWAVVTPDGRYDGTESLLSSLLWKPDGQELTESNFQPLIADPQRYVPGLLSVIMNTESLETP